MKLITLFCSLFFSMAAGAADISEATRTEIDHLFSHLESSGCQFNRNGSWYSAAEASAHLKKKYDYLADKNQITTTESFIEKAATESSMSGKAYEVKCGEAGSVFSAEWFMAALQEYRKSKNH